MANTLHSMLVGSNTRSVEPSQHAAHRRDTFRGMPAKNLDQRGVRIPLPAGHWWPAAAMEAANRRADDLGIRRPGIRSLADALAAAGVDADEHDVGRCLRGKIVTWDVAVPLSKVLGIPPPATISDSRDNAALMESTDELSEVRALLDRLRNLDDKRRK